MSALQILLHLCFKPVALLSLLLIMNAANADISFRELTKTAYNLEITGEIKPSDASMLIKHYDMVLAESKKPPAYMVHFNSPGGNVAASLKIGRVLRKSTTLAQVLKDAVCLSSCVYAFAGAADRGVYGLIGIHRPYEPNDQQLSPAQQKAKYDRLGENIVAYLKEMNIPTRLYEDSLFISPERVKYLDDAEQQSYGLSANDPYTEEANAVKKAQMLGISRKELAARANKVRRQCHINEDEERMEKVMEYFDCEDAILKGKD